ncbi:hypothetical protein [Streptomyces paludis]|nr:hypothetical protein [Streptomyces paludis]
MRASVSAGSVAVARISGSSPSVSRSHRSGLVRESRAEEGALLMLEWTKEGMAAHGWFMEETLFEEG